GRGSFIFVDAIYFRRCRCGEELEFSSWPTAAVGVGVDPFSKPSFCEGVQLAVGDFGLIFERPIIDGAITRRNCATASANELNEFSVLLLLRCLGEFGVNPFRLAAKPACKVASSLHCFSGDNLGGRITRQLTN